MSPLPEHLLLQVVSVITDPVTTTDELIPSGETSSLRSNPLKLAEYTLSRKDPGYVGRAKAVHALETARLANPGDADLLAKARGLFAVCGLDTLQGAADLRHVGMRGLPEYGPLRLRRRPPAFLSGQSRQIQLGCRRRPACGVPAPAAGRPAAHRPPDHG